MAFGPKPNPETVEVLLDTLWRVTASEAAVTEDLDRKASTLATFASVVLSLTASLGAGFLEAFAEQWAFALYVAGLLALLGSVALAVRVLWPKGHVTLSMARIERFPMWSEILKSPEQVRERQWTPLSKRWPRNDTSIGAKGATSAPRSPSFSRASSSSSLRPLYSA